MKIMEDDSIVVGGCKICDQVFRTYRNLLSHLQQHCGDVFYLIEFPSSPTNPEIINDCKISENDEIFTTTPEPTISPIAETAKQKIEREKLPKLKLETTEIHRKNFVYVFPENISTAKRPTMVRLAETCDNLNYFTCSECIQTFDKAEKYNDHLNIHINSSSVASSSMNKNESSTEIYQDFKCINCDRSFADVNQYHDHLKISHGVETLSCDVCDQQFRTKFELNRHMGAHNGGSYECQDCGSCFRVKKLLARHVFYHNSSSNVADDDCRPNSTVDATPTPDRRSPLDGGPEVDDDCKNIDSQDVACTSNDYLDELLASTVSNRPKRSRSSRLPPIPDRRWKSTKIEHSAQNSSHALHLNGSETNSIQTDDGRNGEKFGNYFLDLVETNVCKYKHKNVSNFGAFNYYLSNCMDTASVDKGATAKRKSFEET